MTRRWNGKQLIDDLGEKFWDSSASFRDKIIRWANEIQDDIVSEIPQEYMKIRIKKLLPTQKEVVSLSPQVPSAATVAASSGGSLTDGTTYKVWTSFLIYDETGDNYIESEAVESAAVSPTGANLTISVSAIDTYDGDTTVEPTQIYRRIYLAAKASGETSYAEPFYVGDITDNTTTTYSITAEPSSTITPPSSTEVDQISSDHLKFEGGRRYLIQQSKNRIKRYSPSISDSTSPIYFDFHGLDKIILYPRLSASATTAQRTLTYSVFRRPHEIFYDVDRPIDLPIQLKKALIEGITWKMYEFRDRSGKESVQNNYEQYKRAAIRKLTRQRGRPDYVRDVTGSADGWEV